MGYPNLKKEGIFTYIYIQSLDFASQQVCLTTLIQTIPEFQAKFKSKLDIT